MKKKLRFPITIAGIILVSALLLTTSIFTLHKMDVAAKSPETEPGVDLSETVTGPLTPQQQMQIKFNYYNSEYTDESDPSIKILRIYSNNDAQRLANMREDKEVQSLTREEILFLLSDTVRLYSEYDEIILTDAFKHGVYHDPENEGSRTVKTLDFNFYENSPEGSNAKLNRIIYDISVIFMYRCYMYDTAMQKCYEIYHYRSGLYGGITEYVMDLSEAMYDNPNFYTSVYFKLLDESNDYDADQTLKEMAALTYDTQFDTRTSRQISGLKYSCLLILEGGIEIIHPDGKVETFYVQDYIDVPDWLIEFNNSSKFIPVRMYHPVGKPDRWLYSRRLVKGKSAFCM